MMHIAYCIGSRAYCDILCVCLSRTVHHIVVEFSVLQQCNNCRISNQVLLCISCSDTVRLYSWRTSTLWCLYGSRLCYGYRWCSLLLPRTDAAVVITAGARLLHYSSTAVLSLSQRSVGGCCEQETERKRERSIPAAAVDALH